MRGPGRGVVAATAGDAPALAGLAARVAVTLARSAGGADVEGSGSGPPPALSAPVVELARRHGVLALLPGGDHEVAAARREILADVVRAGSDLAVTAGAAASAGAPVMAVKGAVLGRQVYPRADLRPFADVDLLTTPARFGALLAALEAAGGVVQVRNWDLMLRRGLSEVSVRMPAGTVLDVHWHLVNRARLRRVFRLDTDRFLEQGLPGGPAGLLVPPLVAHLGYVCWHGTLSGGTRLLWAVDAELLARRVPDGAGALVEWARSSGTEAAVGVALDFAAVAFPGGAAEALAARLPAGLWRIANRRLKEAVLRRPAGRRSGAFLPRATRRGTAGSLAALRPPGLLTRSGPGSPVVRGDALSVDAGGEAGRAAYLRAVAHAGRDPRW